MRMARTTRRPPREANRLSRERRQWRAGLVSALVLGLLATACSSTPPSESSAGGEGPGPVAAEPNRGEPTTSEAVTTSEPDEAAVTEEGLSSTSEIAAPGGSHGTAVHVPVAELPEVTDVAVHARVTHIGTARLNTASGSWDPPDDATAEELHGTYSELVPLTEITLEVDDVLGARPSSSLRVEPGDTVVVTVLGGDHPITLTADQARKIGVTVPTSEPDGEAKPPDGPLDLRASMAPAVDLAVSDDVVAFLNHQTMEFSPGPDRRDIVVSVRAEGWGIYSAEGASDRRVNTASGREVATEELKDAARSLDRHSGSSRRYSG